VAQNYDLQAVSPMTSTMTHEYKTLTYKSKSWGEFFKISMFVLLIYLLALLGHATLLKIIFKNKGEHYE